VSPIIDQPQPAPRAAVPVLLLLVFMSLIGFGVVIPLLPFYGQVFQAQAWQVTLMFTAYSAGGFVGELFWGPLSDRIGRRPVLLITTLGSMLGYLGLAFAPGIWTAVAVRAFAGFFAGNISVIQGYIVDATPPERLASRIGLVGSTYGLGFIVGPALGGLMARPELGSAGFHPPLFVSAAMCLAAGVGILWFVKEVRAPNRLVARRNPFAGLGEAARHPIIAGVLGAAFFGFFASSIFWSVLGLWFDARFGWDPKQVGLVMALTGVAAALTQGLLSSQVSRRIGNGATIAGGMVIAGLTMFAMAGSPLAWMAVTALVISVIGHSAWQPAATAIASQSADPDRQGAILGALGASGSAARVVGPIFAGALFSGIGPWAPIVFAAIWMLPGAWLGWRAATALRRRAAE
jgi:DHA1 family tetracycline resistance protein-like MFS transporter